MPKRRLADWRIYLVIVYLSRVRTDGDRKISNDYAADVVWHCSVQIHTVHLVRCRLSIGRLVIVCFPVLDLVGC